MTEPGPIVTAQIELDLRRTRRITPSAISPWFGNWEEGEELTLQQRAGLIQAGIGAPEIMSVFIRTTAAQLWVPGGSEQPYRNIRCPVLQRRTDGRCMVITPAGFKKLVYQDGLTRRPWAWPRR